MPLYEFQCRSCEKRFETLVSHKEFDDPVKCPDCGSEETDRRLSTFSASAGGSSRGSPSCGPGDT